MLRLSAILLLLFVGISSANATDITYCKGVSPKGVVPIVSSKEAPYATPFLGEWIGNWSDEMCTSIIITEILGNGKVTVRYTIAGNDQWNVDATSFDMEGIIEGSKLTMTTSSGSDLAFTLKSNNVMDGEYWGYAKNETELYKTTKQAHAK